METTLYKITFKDGREYRVFCANKAQKERMHKTVDAIREKDGSIPEILQNGIHTIKQWEDIIKVNNN